MTILIVEDEFLLALLLADALSSVGYRVLGPVSCRAEALRLLADEVPQLAFVDIELRDGESGIEVATDLRRHGVACVFATGQPDRARKHRELALGLVSKPYNPTTLIDAARYFEALHAGERPEGVPRGLELFGPDPLPVGAGMIDTSVPAMALCASSDAAETAPSEVPLREAAVLEAVTG
jgi:DNA-binding response OmpR family regulator